MRRQLRTASPAAARVAAGRAVVCMSASAVAMALPESGGGRGEPTLMSAGDLGDGGQGRGDTLHVESCRSADRACEQAQAGKTLRLPEQFDISLDAVL
jgi:hypothetical protein